MNIKALSTALSLDNTPSPDKPVVLLMRHAERPDIPANETGNDLKLTPRGQEATRQLGQHLISQVASLTASPIERCVETALLIKHASESAIDVEQSRVLGAPGAYVHNEDLAWSYWLEHGSEFVLDELMDDDKHPPGLNSASNGTNMLLDYCHKQLMTSSGYHINVTHDVVLLPFISQLLEIPINEVPWPDFLQTASLYLDNSRLVLNYQSFTHVIRTPLQ